MALVALTCPHCGFSKDMDETRLPPAGTRVNCPRCKGKFPLSLDVHADSTAVEAPDARFDPPPQRFAAPDPSFAPPAPPGPALEPFTAGLAADAGIPEPLGLKREPPSPPPPEPPLAPPAGFQRPAQPPRRRTLTFSFTGNAREYFGIWIVNTLLRIVTLGLYSPWAKVRKRRYFYGNTRLDRASFDFLGDPLAILKGWLIAGAFFGLYSLASHISPIAAAAMALVFAALFPWVVVRSRIFNLRNSTHRNIRFSFKPNYADAYRVFLWWSLLVPFTLGILAPYVMYRQKKFLVENSAYGTTPFTFHATPRDYYRLFIPPLVTLLLGGGLVGWTVVTGTVSPGTTSRGGMAIPLVFVIVAFYYIVGVWVPAVMTNITWSSTSIGGLRFKCELRPRDLCWIYISNALAMPLSLGLLAPWATVRLLNYRLGKMSLTGIGDLDSVAAGADEAVGATGEELGDMLGFDLGI